MIHAWDYTESAKKATPSKISKDKLALQHVKVSNAQIPSNEWINLNSQIVITSKQTKFTTRRFYNIKIGLNILSKILYITWENTPGIFDSANH